MQSIFSIITCFAFSIFLSCSNIEQEVGDREKAVEQLNRRNYDEAIILLNKLLEESPDDELRVLLASAYAGSTGLNVVDAFDVFQPLIFRENRALPKRNKPSTSDKKENIPQLSLTFNSDPQLADSSSQEDTIEALKIYSIQLFDSLSDGFSVIFSMPYSEPVQRRKINQAILILEQIPENSDQYIKAKHYAILLNLIQFLNYIKDAFPELGTSRNLRMSDLLCSFAPSPFFSNLDASFSYFISMIQNFKIIRISQEKEMSEQLLRLESSLQLLMRTYSEKKHSILLINIAFNELKQKMCK